MGTRSGLAAFTTGAVLLLPLLLVVALPGAPVAAEQAPDQVRTVVFELFTPPQASGG